MKNASGVLCPVAVTRQAWHWCTILERLENAWRVFGVLISCVDCHSGTSPLVGNLALFVLGSGLGFKQRTSVRLWLEFPHVFALRCTFVYSLSLSLLVFLHMSCTCYGFLVCWFSSLHSFPLLTTVCTRTKLTIVTIARYSKLNCVYYCYCLTIARYSKKCRCR